MNDKLDNTLLQGKAILEDVGLPYFLVGGTLLGIVREGGLLAHDKDVDVACLEEDLNEKTRKKMMKFKQFGGVSDSRGHYAFAFDEVPFDVFVMKKIGNRRCFNQSGVLGLWWPEEMIERPWSEVEYRGIKWNAPKDIDGFLTHMYGDWHVEDKNFQWNANSLNYLEDIR
ncbi:MAG: LicD family protein [Candidatus Bipolaricaulis sp.]|nr:LicD family protein [Candidatus Bipolaricaulis sp.]